MDINLIIFSKDRPLQLEALLRSIKLNCDIFSDIKTICKWSNKEFDKGYNKLSYQPIDNELYLYENHNEGFYNSLVECIEDKYEYTCFMVDDIICYREFDESSSALDALDVGHQYSLRLGKNINGYLYTPMQWNEQLDYQETKSDFDYPFSVDGHIYKTETIKKILTYGKPINPNKFEVLGYSHRNLLPAFIAYPAYSTCVSIPVNRVSDTATASYGIKYGYTQKELNDRFLKGEIMDFENMDFSKVDSCHKEIKFKFTNQNK